MGIRKIKELGLTETGYSNIYMDREGWFGLSSMPDEGTICVPCNLQRLTFGSDQMYNFFMTFPKSRMEYSKLVLSKDMYMMEPGSYEYLVEDNYDIALLFIADKLVGKNRDSDPAIMAAFSRVIDELTADYEEGHTFRLPIINVGDMALTQRMLYVLSIHKDYNWIIHTK